MKQQIFHDDLVNTTFDRDNRDKDHVPDSMVRDAARITKAYVQTVKAWGLDDSDAAKMLAVDCQTWTQIKNEMWKGSLNREQLKRIRAVTTIYDILLSFLDEEEADRWATVPNRLPMFHGRKPVDIMIEGGLPVMEKAQHHTYGLLAGM